MINDADKTHVTHKGMLGWIGVPIGVISIIISLVLVIVSAHFGNLQQNLIVSKQRNDYQDQRITACELTDKKVEGDLGVIREKLNNMDKNISTIMERIK